MALRRLSNICNQIEASPTAADANTGAEIAEILKLIGPSPLKITSKQMYYVKNPELPPYAERGKAVGWNGKNTMDNYIRNPAVVERINKLPRMSQSDIYTQVAKALLFYAADAMDEGHSLAAIVSGEKRFKDVPDGQRDATYAHAIVHRNEGTWRGNENVQNVPGGSPGFNSSGIIQKILYDSKEGPHELYPTLFEMAKGFAKGKPKLEAHIAQHGPKWKAYEFVKFCMEATEGKNPEAVEFVEKMYNAEWKLLLDHVLSKAQIAVPASA